VVSPVRFRPSPCWLGSLYFPNVANLSNAIQALQPDGFQVGTDCRVNEGSASSYHWIVFKDAG
jgi:hypothetical protein